MLLDGDGSLHIENSKTLFHALSLKNFYKLLESSHIHFRRDSDQPDRDESPRIDLAELSGAPSPDQFQIISSPNLF